MNRVESEMFVRKGKRKNVKQWELERDRNKRELQKTKVNNKSKRDNTRRYATESTLIVQPFLTVFNSYFFLHECICVRVKRKQKW